MKIFIVKLDYSTEDCHDVELHAFKDYYKAYDKFKELICNERQPENSWVGDLDFEDNNTFETDVWWRIEDTWDSRYYVYIDLLVLEVE